MKGIRILVCVGSLFVATPSARAQAPTPPVPAVLDTIRHSLATELQAQNPARQLGLQNDIDYVALVARRSSSLVRLLQKYEEERSDKQLGATTSAPGTTTLVSKGTVPKILGLAVENGAVTRSQSGTTVTFRSNLGGSVRALAGKGFFDLVPGDDPALAALGRISLSASFDTSRGNQSGDTTLTGDKQQLAQWTARVQLVDRRDPNSARAMTGWERLRPSQQALSNASGALEQTLLLDLKLQAWLADTAKAIQAAQAAARTASKAATAEVTDIETVLKAREQNVPEVLNPETLAALDEYERSAGDFVTQRRDLLHELSRGTLASVEYTNDRPVKAPRTSNLRLVYEVGGSVDLTANASVTLFDQRPAGVSRRLRDIQASGEMDMKMGSADTVGAYVLAVSFKYTRQLENSFSDAGIMLPDTKGTTTIGQLKLTVPVKGSGAKIPLSITVANRTEFIKESTIRANFGITYDLDFLFSRLRP